ncbi:phenylacetyl-ligase [Grosmannia clavigera kw1407]|uniref:Phenylacetyl-ligase n=1 Tax=Grosmannia clavigera (strain kw1407 / UAMH 11150) TaxID=655863 RepID=F0XJ45_GROCL|nr:phenylacetyl-ligase [Grosmannia clavigera kw1407]EFX02406.1 phenylacetyl-ligase [Grosmannia clavigera kw1407]
MVFHPPAWVPQLPIDPPDSVTIEQFMTSEKFGRSPLVESRNPFTCGLTGKTRSWVDLVRRADFLARALGKRLGWQPNQGTPWDKVVAVFSLNSIDYIPALYAIHRFSGIATPANAAYSAAELQHQLVSSGTQAVFTCLPLLETALTATRAIGIPDENVFLLDFPALTPDAQQAAADVGKVHSTVDQLIDEGSALPRLEPLRWTEGQGARQPAFLCYSSGTSGLPKAVMISHRNVIANVLQIASSESVGREKKGIRTQVVIGLLPFSHIYGLVVVAHSTTFRGDEVIVLPKFELESFLATIQRFRVEMLHIVPPILVRLMQTQDICSKYDLSSIRFFYCGAAPIGEETIDELKRFYPHWVIGQGYGMTETSTVVCSTSEHDIFTRSSGSLVQGAKAKIIDFDGKEVSSYDTPGELYVQSPSVVLGYLNNEKASAETFVNHDDGRWIRTGDEVIVTKAPSGNEHIIIVDRIKELIKVKGHQVAPAELEAHLLTHPAVADAAVIQIPDDNAGEVPKAFVVKADGYASKSDEELARSIARHVEEHKASYKWLKGGVEFIDEIPKTPSGKILRRLLRDQEKAKRKKAGSKL